MNYSHLDARGEKATVTVTGSLEIRHTIDVKIPRSSLHLAPVTKEMFPAFFQLEEISKAFSQQRTFIYF